MKIIIISVIKIKSICRQLVLGIAWVVLILLNALVDL